MKKQISYLSMLLLLFTITATYGQNNPAAPRRTPSEQAAFEKSVPLNPAKIAPETQVDSRLTPGQVQVGPTNWKPEIVPMDVRKNTPVISQVNPANGTIQSAPAMKRTQQEGTQPQGKTVNYRDIKGPKTQPEAPKSGEVTNYRDVKGPKTQPEGQKPK